MKITNTSNYPTGKIREALRILSKHTEYSMMADLIVVQRKDTVDFHNEEEDSTMTLAATWKQKPSLETVERFGGPPKYTHGPAPSLIILHIGTSNFPHSTKSRYNGEEIVFADLDEEVFFVLAHELRHIEQLWKAGLVEELKLTDIELLEADADRFATERLDDYQLTSMMNIKID